MVRANVMAPTAALLVAAASCTLDSTLVHGTLREPDGAPADVGVRLREHIQITATIDVTWTDEDGNYVLEAGYEENAGASYFVASELGEAGPGILIYFTPVTTLELPEASFWHGDVTATNVAGDALVTWAPPSAPEPATFVEIYQQEGEDTSLMWRAIADLPEATIPAEVIADAVATVRVLNGSLPVPVDPPTPLVHRRSSPAALTPGMLVPPSRGVACGEAWPIGPMPCFATDGVYRAHEWEFPLYVDHPTGSVRAVVAYGVSADVDALAPFVVEGSMDGLAFMTLATFALEPGSVGYFFAEFAPVEARFVRFRRELGSFSLTEIALY
jgi:hypothetical protein